VSLAAAAVLGPVLVLGLRPFTGLAERLQQCVLLGLAAFSAPAAGYALVIGPEAFARMPATLCVPGLIATLVLAAFAWPRPAVPGWALGGVLGALVGGAAAWAWSVPAGVAGLFAGLFAGLLGDVADSAISERRGRGWTSLLTGLACLMVVVAGTSRLSPAHEALRERAGCVARLELIRGKEYAQEGRLDLARNAFRRALECEPRYVRAREALGLSFIRERDFERGIEHLEQAREIEPEASTVLSNLGAAYLHAGELDRARHLLDRAVSARPRDPNALYNRAEVYTALGDEPQALAAWKRYLRAAEGRPEEAEHVDRARRRINRLESRLGSPADPS
jgi:tetratricopeptide (TPR) repeat protein